MTEEDIKKKVDELQNEIDNVRQLKKLYEDKIQKLNQVMDKTNQVAKIANAMKQMYEKMIVENSETR